MREPAFTETLQVALVVRDLEAAMRTYVHDYGIGPWAIYEFNPDTVRNMTAEGEPIECAWRLALARVGQVHWELIQPLDDRSTYGQFLAEKGEGVHHVGVAVPSFDDAIGAVADRGRRDRARRRVQRRHLRVSADRRRSGRDHGDLRRAAGGRSAAGFRLPLSGFT